MTAFVVIIIANLIDPITLLVSAVSVLTIRAATTLNKWLVILVGAAVSSALMLFIRSSLGVTPLFAIFFAITPIVCLVQTGVIYWLADLWQKQK